MKDNEGYFKKNFAKFLAKYEDENYEANKSKKVELFKDLKGEVLELGPGTGANFVFLKDHPIEWLGIEPNKAMYQFLFKKANEYNLKANLLDCTSESISLDDNSVDCVISTEVLCSVFNIEQSLNEILRVLKPNGKFLFLEHVIDKRNLVRRIVQKTVPFTPWKWYSDGCNPGRDIGSHIEQVGFSKVKYSNYMKEGKGIINLINKPHIYGYAIK